MFARFSAGRHRPRFDPASAYFSMILRLEIPDSLLAATGLTEAVWSREAKKELGLAFYARGFLSLGKAVELAETSRMEFERWLAERQIERPFSEEELARELASAE
jgi:predicted HTH domain antitoxin